MGLKAVLKSYLQYQNVTFFQVTYEGQPVFATQSSSLHLTLNPTDCCATVFGTIRVKVFSPLVFLTVFLLESEVIELFIILGSCIFVFLAA